MRDRCIWKGLMITFLGGCALALAHAGEASLALGFSARNTEAEGFFPLADLRLAHDYQGFGFGLEFLARTDGLYPAPESQFGPIYFLVREGGVWYDSKSLRLKAGVFEQKDLADTPYSLFFSSRGNSALSLQYGLDDGVLFYETRWLGLNVNSALFRQSQPVLDANGVETGGQVSLPFDRGLSYRTLGLRLGDFRLAYQESVVYTGSYFDPYYFLVPLPGYFSQYIRNAGGAPWQSAKPWGQVANDNFITGLLLDYRSGDWYAVLQVLIDDINLNRIIAPNDYQNPDKIALSSGARYRTAIGVFGLFTAMATKYTFQPFGDGATNHRYGYYYYPAVETDRGVIPREDNSIGLINGENSWGLMAEWGNQGLAQAWGGIELSAALGFTLTGSQSPAKAWTDVNYWSDAGQGAKWLDDPVLEKKVSFRLDASLPLKPLSIELGTTLAYVWNELRLDWPINDPSPATHYRLYRPSEHSRFLVRLDLSLKLDILGLLALLPEAPQKAAPRGEVPGAEVQFGGLDASPAELAP